MTLTVKQFVKYIAILYLLGVKGLAESTISDMFSDDPILREEWLCKITSRNDLTRFLRQVCECKHVCVECVSEYLCAYLWPFEHCARYQQKAEKSFF